jgi:hypothetical protein
MYPLNSEARRLLGTMIPVRPLIPSTVCAGRTQRAAAGHAQTGSLKSSMMWSISFTRADYSSRQLRQRGKPLLGVLKCADCLLALVEVQRLAGCGGSRSLLAAACEHLSQIEVRVGLHL